MQHDIAHALDRIETVLAAKAKEYATDHDPFHNFKAATNLSFHTIPEKVGWEYMTKHLQSIKDLIEKAEKDQPLTLDAIDEKFGDAINYLILIESMLRQRVTRGETVCHDPWIPDEGEYIDTPNHS